MPGGRNTAITDQGRETLFPGQDIELWDRLMTYQFGGPGAITDHFRGTALLAAWAWAGAPFAVPGTVTVELSAVKASNMVGNRAFLYQNTITTSAKVVLPGLHTYNVGVACGVRLDDGSDNNYVESVLYCSQGSPTQWIVQGRQRVGGGVVATQNGDAMDHPGPFVLRMSLTGTTWTAWQHRTTLLTPLSFGARMFKPLGAVGVAQAWTPTRSGVIFDLAAAGAAVEAGMCDWIDIE